MVSGHHSARNIDPQVECHQRASSVSCSEEATRYFYRGDHTRCSHLWGTRGYSHPQLLHRGVHTCKEVSRSWYVVTMRRYSYPWRSFWVFVHTTMTV